MSPFISRCCFQLSSCLTLGRRWKKHADFWQHAGLFFLFSFFHPKCHDSLIAKISLKPLLISWEAWNHILHVGQSSTGNHYDSSVSFCLLQGCVQLSWRCRIGNIGGERGEEKAASPSAFVSIMCHDRSRLSCSVWLSLLLQQSPLPRWESVSLRGRRGSLLHQFQVGSAYLHGLHSHLPDTRSSADTSSLHGLSWLTGSCPYE